MCKIAKKRFPVKGNRKTCIFHIKTCNYGLSNNASRTKIPFSDCTDKVPSYFSAIRFMLFMPNP